MKTDPMFNLSTKKKFTREQKVTIGLIVTGILSILLVLITIYGQYTGTFVIKLTHTAEKKGIKLSQTNDFINKTERLVLNPVNDTEDMIEENIIRIDEILASEGGQYEDPDGNYNYIAYTFFLKNVGEEVVNLRYDFRIVSQQKNLDRAMTIIFYEHSLTGEEPQKDYYHKTSENNYLGGKRIPNFQVGETRKFTLIVFIDGVRSNATMLGGAVKINLIFTVETAEEA
ncbi:MAG: hypothetical protein ACOX56_01380 [Acholeplasmataceae bacterium]